MNLSKLYNACVKCGKCIPECTIHKINSDEITSPRGFLDLLQAYKEGDIKLDKEAKKVFESCFLCTNCVEVCPNHIQVDNAIENIRYDIAKKFGIAWYKKLIFYFLNNRKILDIVAKFGFVFQSCAFKIHDKNDGMQAKFSMPFIKKGRFLTSFKKKSFLNSNPDFIDNGGSQNIGFFVGCLSNYFYIEGAKSVLKVAKALKINVDLMKEQLCCGAPQFFTGDFKSVSKLAKQNIIYFEKKLEKLDFIITIEATCSAMINVDYEHFFTMQNELDWAKRAKEISSKIILATKFFHDHTKLLELLKDNKKQNLSLTYHDPCHARKMQGVFKEPRTLLKQNFVFKELENSNSCCGFGGVSMQSDYYEKSLEVGIKKAKDIEKCEVLVVSAECSACRMQISNALIQNKSKTIFKNPLELIAMALEDK
ncbi:MULTISPECIES: (Fe-S)-binding protein [unclassified Campylobacter]|uniref:(Fe-S)-binding protein n=1 Tax=unclassified Campylobacter TaxID=2593542 RepID=UPI001237CC6A|nr:MULTISPECIES: (Fe-S)-binding protein [unclassified Campylobacter]KAA6226721.1 (Fe-S)-binding protein [Campylobacter sp. LR196d]KAA6228683.1 (Fe-S)-binding protein [Campylobacter sp. LR185c]KAA6229086.1 (Fe-S)-binding protein [Campylobacter sp. LR286c]KAA6230158.1 (Fe-S)-binding protein [Campylobacter sp. LR291e]KAA6233679.1 (Fe-S)-binding protein [Campylobacter sp. LR264d]